MLVTDLFRNFIGENKEWQSSKLDEWVEMAKTFPANISPKFSFGADPMNDFSLLFEWSPKDDTDVDLMDNLTLWQNP